MFWHCCQWRITHVCKLIYSIHFTLSNFVKKTLLKKLHNSSIHLKSCHSPIERLMFNEQLILDGINVGVHLCTLLWWLVLSPVRTAIAVTGRLRCCVPIVADTRPTWRGMSVRCAAARSCIAATLRFTRRCTPQTERFTAPRAESPSRAPRLSIRTRSQTMTAFLNKCFYYSHAD